MSASRSVHDWRLLGLDPGGRSLIEASAGTGKTWTISVLYLRLLLERALSPRQIVVATFTEAAAQELRERIRARIGWALARLTGGDEGDDPAAQWLRARRGQAQAGVDAARLRLALAELDLAPIGTLHGLCRRILHEFPLASRAPLRLGELVDGAQLEQELLDDLWRTLAQSAGEPAGHAAVAWSLGRRTLDRYLREALAPGVTVAPADATAQAELADPAFAQRLRAAVAATRFARSSSALPARLLEVADFAAAGAADRTRAQALAEGLAKALEQPHKQFHASLLQAQAHLPMLEQARRLVPVLEAAALAPTLAALAHYQHELRVRIHARLASAGELSFNALIERVQAALRDDAQDLGALLHAAWPVALVDEFQDTDALQYDILDRIYRAGDGTPRGRLVMIGDPKQAIYRFRGGDIDAYLAARAVADEHMTLTTNFRSAPAYVAALNELYAASGRVLSADPAHAIRCEEVSADPARRELCTVDGAACLQPLQIHLLEAPPDGQDERIEAALGACANHIVALLDGGHAIGGVPLQPRNIAVLAHARRHLVRLRELLHQRRVPCVVPGGASVFASEWARELQVLLYAALHPGDVRALRAALATRLGGHDWQRLRALGGDDPAAQQAGRWVHELGELWRRRGVLALVRAVIEHAGAALRAGADHERALTDLRHLGELLQEHSAQVTGGDELLAWLARQREVGDARRDGDERELRIESDAARVSLLTLHASKGLEFDIVLLPLMWAHAAPRNDEVAVLHDAASGTRRLRLDAAARERQRCQAQEERHRLLYVALTRARHACHVYALPPTRTLRGAVAADPQRAPLDAMLERLLATPQRDAMPHVRRATGWPWPQAVWQGAGQARGERHARVEPPPPVVELRYSYSALARNAPATPGEMDAAGDERDTAADAGSAASADAPLACAALAPLAAVAGTAFGNAVHAVLEGRELQRPLTQQHDLIARALRDARVRIDAQTADALVVSLAQRLQHVLDSSLLDTGGAPLRLGALPAHAQCAEMEFNFVLDGVSLRALREACPWLPGTSMRELRGLMNGKIDLVCEHAGRFHVIDYKTNRLGDGHDLAAYLPARLEAAMDEHHYRFQALLYTVAVERYLRQRVRDYRRGQHLGATLYLFVRAVGIEPSQPQAGIWTQRFDDALLDAVDRVLAGTATARSAP